MDSPQSVVSPFKNLSVSGSEPEKQRSDVFVRGSNSISDGANIGVLDVHVHHARDIQNICIYHKQDVYARLCLTNDPDNTVSTQTINGGGQNPVFNDKVRLSVKTIETSLKCEIWMLSRVRNYLEDQLLGFALVPLSEILTKNGEVDREFPLSSTDFFHSPAGFVQLSLAYSGSLPDVIAIPKLPSNNPVEKAENSESFPCDLEKIEFPDPILLNESQMMVSEYVGMECIEDSHTSESLKRHELGVRVVESLSANSEHAESPPSCFSIYSSPCQSSESQVTSKSPDHEHVSPLKEKKEHIEKAEGKSSNGHARPKETLIRPPVAVNIEPVEQMVQQDIVDMYMKSMQQFTDSLAKMKLPMDLTTETTKSGDSGSDQTTETPKSTAARVFYGSRAFF